MKRRLSACFLLLAEAIALLILGSGLAWCIVQAVSVHGNHMDDNTARERVKAVLTDPHNAKEGAHGSTK